MNERSNFLSVLTMIIPVVMGQLYAGTPAQTGEAPPPRAPHSLLEPFGDFVRDDIWKPVQPFVLFPGKDPNGWSFVIEPYVWAMGLTGDIGVKGLPPGHMDFSSRTVLQNLDWGIFVRGEVRKGRWGLLADGYYAALSGSGNLDNKIYDSVSLNLQQSLVSLALAYRVIDDRRGFLDFYAGVRYNFLGLQTDASLNASRINQIGIDSANVIAGRIQQDLNAKISTLAATDLSKLESLVRRQTQVRLQETIVASDPDLRDLVRDGIIRHKLTQGRVSRALEDYIRAEVQARVNRTDSRLRAAASAAKMKLATAISKEIENATPTYASGDQWWFDPIIGLRGQISLTRWLFLAAQGDVGGFGAGSQIAWNAQATIGVNFTRNLFAEIGYRYMYVDYANGGFLYDMSSYGLYSGIGVKF